MSFKKIGWTAASEFFYFIVNFNWFLFLIFQKFFYPLFHILQMLIFKILLLLFKLSNIFHSFDKKMIYLKHKNYQKIWKLWDIQHASIAPYFLFLLESNSTCFFIFPRDFTIVSWNLFLPCLSKMLTCRIWIMWLNYVVELWNCWEVLITWDVDIG